MHNHDGWTWRVGSGYSEVVFEDIGSASEFHKTFYGGAGYKRNGAINSVSEKADIVLIGDSHAGHLLEGIYKVIIKPKNLSLYASTGTSCITLPNFTRVTGGANWDKMCSDSLKQGLDYLNTNDNSVLIVATSWVSQMNRADILDENGQRTGKEVSKEDVLDALLKLKSKIGSKKLVVVGVVPGAGENLYDIFTRPSFSAKNDLTTYLKSSSKDSFVEFNNFLDEQSKKTQKFIFLNPFDIFCKNNLCSNIDSEKRLVYSDKSHLSKYGSVMLIDGFKDELLKTQEQ